jgi:mannose-6-phosphate isomerase-like protein (cupin superfamily)
MENTMNGYIGHIEQETLKNDNFRKVLYTARHAQLVLMCLKPGEEIDTEIHTVDQFFRFEQGEGKAVLDGTEHPVKNGDVVIVPAGMKHNIINTSSSEPLKLYSLYCPPHHKDGTVHQTKEVAAGDSEHFDGVTTAV